MPNRTGDVHDNKVDVKNLEDRLGGLGSEERIVDRKVGPLIDKRLYVQHVACGILTTGMNLS